MATINKRINKNGDVVFRIRVCRGYTADGKKLTPFSTEWVAPKGMSEKKAEKEAQRVAALFEEQCKFGVAGDGKQKFSVYAEYVIDTKVQSGELRKHTLARYLDLLKRINAGIGHMKLCDIRPQHLNQFYREISKDGVRKDLGRAVVKCECDIKLIIRKKRRMTIEQFSKLSGVSKTSIRSAASGQQIADTTAQKIADALGVEPKEMFDITIIKRALAPKTVLEHHRLIHLILRQAEKELLIPYNPADRATPPKASRPRARFFDKEDVAAILEAVENEPLKWKMIIHLLLATGGRRGEVLGLTWDNVDFVFNRVHIVRTIGYEKEFGVFVDKTKNETSDRWIRLPAETMQLLKQYKSEYYEPLKVSVGDIWEGDGSIFVQDSGEHIGRPMHPDSVTGYCASFSERYGLPHINPHAFRHTQASLLLFAGLDIITVSRRLGHAKPSTTSDLYAHVLQEAESRVADTIGSIIFSTKKERQKDASDAADEKIG